MVRERPFPAGATRNKRGPLSSKNNHATDLARRTLAPGVGKLAPGVKFPQIMKLLGNRVLLEPLPLKVFSPGGILFTQIWQDDEKQYRVLAVGPGRKLKNGTVVPPEVKPGDYVLAELYGEHIKLPDGRRIIDAKDILAVWPG